MFGDFQPFPVCQLVGGWTNPFEKYARQIGSFPPILGMKIKKSLKPQPSKGWKSSNCFPTIYKWLALGFRASPIPITGFPRWTSVWYIYLHENDKQMHPKKMLAKSTVRPMDRRYGYVYP